MYCYTDYDTFYLTVAYQPKSYHVKQFLLLYDKYICDFSRDLTGMFAWFFYSYLRHTLVRKHKAWIFFCIVMYHMEIKKKPITLSMSAVDILDYFLKQTHVVASSTCVSLGVAVYSPRDNSPPQSLVAGIDTLR